MTLDLEQFRPVVGSAPYVTINFPTLKISEEPIIVWYAEMKGFINNGYAIRLQILNVDFKVLEALISGEPQSNTYFSTCRSQPIPIEIIFNQGSSNTQEKRGKTQKITAMVTTVYSHGLYQLDMVDIIAIDPFNWAMRVGDAEGLAFRGKLSSVITQVVNRYAPSINLSIEETVDNPKGVWWSLRRSPKEMVSHWLNMATSLSKGETPWMIGIDGLNVKIGPQTSFESKIQGYYRKFDTLGDGEIQEWDAILNPSIGNHEMGLITAGVSATTGKHLDQITDDKNSIVTDSNTTDKYVPITVSNQYKSTIRPSETFKPESYGRSFIESPPEYYNGGEIGVNYKEYYDTYARTEYMRNVYKLFTIEIQVPGHGMWDSTMGLGSSIAFLDWRNVLFGDSSKTYYLHGHWLVYGFKHIFNNKNGWTTNLKMARVDHNAKGSQVPKQTI